jgi:hypothetical protein
MKLRASLTQQSDEIKGVIDMGNDPAFNLEALLLIVERVAENHKVPLSQVIQDLWRLAHRA